MSDTARANGAYVWVTWLTGLLAGDKHCRYALWYRAHFQYDKLEDADFKMSGWIAQHDAAVEKRKDELRAQGRLVTIEDQNKFHLTGKTGTVLGGKADLVGVKPMVDTLISDAKTGKKRGSDWWQVLIYLWAFERLRRDPKSNRWKKLTAPINGEVVYADQVIQVNRSDLNLERETAIVDMLKEAGQVTPPAATPSGRECKFCDIANCRFREKEIDDEQTVHEDF